MTQDQIRTTVLVVKRGAVIRLIKSAARAGAVHIARHAADNDDSVTVADVLSALATGRSFTWQPERGTWRVVGSDCSGDTLVVIVMLDGTKVIAWTTF